MSKWPNPNPQKWPLLEHPSTFQKKKFATSSFDLPTFGLWAQHASTAPSRAVALLAIRLAIWCWKTLSISYLYLILLEEDTDTRTRTLS